MSSSGNDRTLSQTLRKQGRTMQITGFLFILIQLALSVAMFVILKSNLGLLIGFALFTLSMWFIKDSLDRVYLVTEYRGREIVREYTTHGTVLGGLLRLAGVFLLFMVLEAFVADYIFPDTGFFMQIAYRVGLFWVVGIALLRDVNRIKTGSDILRAAREPNEVLAWQMAEEAKAASEDREDNQRTGFSVGCILLVILLLVIQIVMFAVQGSGIAEQLDMHAAYTAFYERHDGMYDYEQLPLLSEEWFEEALADGAEVKYSRFHTKCRMEGSAILMQDGVPIKISMELHFIYSEDYGWRMAKAYCLESGVDFDSTGDRNISGSWYGVGRDKTMNASDNNELTITLETLTATEAVGSITCQRNGDTYYTKTFRGTVEDHGDYLYIVAAYDQKDMFYPEIRFCYDVVKDQIYNIDISPDTKLSKVTE